MSTDDLESKIKAAAAMAKAVPKNLQETAFNRALDELLRGLGNGGPPPAQRHAGKTGATATGEARGRASGSASAGQKDLEATLEQSIDRTNHPEIFDAPKVLIRAMLLLRAAHDDYGIDGLGATRIAAILTNKFRIRTTPQAVTQAFDRSASLVDRRKNGRSVTYHVMAAGEKFLDAKEWQDGAAAQQKPTHSRTSKPTHRRASKTKGRASATKATGAATKAAEKKRTKGSEATSADQKKRRALGAAPILRDLIAEGYFKSPRTIGDIQAYMCDKKARKFKVTDISPSLTRLVRNRELDREKNSDGQFEYTVR